MVTGIVDVGGGLRGIYAAGILDYCMMHSIQFDCCIGVSAGSANMAAYLAGQQGRNYRYYQEYSFRKEYMGMGNLLHTGSYINLDYIYGTLSNAGGESPLDYDALVRNPAKLLVVATRADTGAVQYFTKDDLHQDHYQILMASSCVPGVNRPYVVNGISYFDGALSDPVPIEKAFAQGCDRVVLILTKPAAIPRKPGKDRVLAGSSIPLPPGSFVCGHSGTIRPFNWPRNMKKTGGCSFYPLVTFRGWIPSSAIAPLCSGCISWGFRMGKSC